MQEAVFETQLLADGHLYCPSQYAKPNARYKVIVTLPDSQAEDNDMELAAAADLSEDFLSEAELDYYMQLDDQT